MSSPHNTEQGNAFLVMESLVQSPHDFEIQFSMDDEDVQMECIEKHKMMKLEPESLSTGHLNLDTERGMIKNPKIENESLNVRKFTCQFCSYITKSDHLLHKHIKTQHNSQRKVYSCHLCEYFCIQERTFQLHQLKHSGQGAKFACDQCGKLFLSMGIMKRHALTHNKLKSFICPTESCGKQFNIKSRLTDHIRYVHNKSRSQSKSHIHEKGSSHTNNDSVIISTANKSCDQLASSERKGKKLSKKSGKYFKAQKDDNIVSCDTSKNKELNLASRTDSDKQSLHLKSQTDFDVISVYDIVLSNTITNNSDINTDTCINSGEPKTIISKSILASVAQPVAPNFVKIKQYVKDGFKNKTSKFTCSWKGCGKTFRDGFNLRMHTYTHTREMQRACKFCGYTCVQKSALDKHMKVHGVDMSCDSFFTLNS